MFRGAANAQVGFGFEFRAGPLHSSIGSRTDFDIELEVAKKGRTVASRVWGNQRARGVEALGEINAFHGNFSGKQAALQCAGKMKRAGGQPTHALWIANAYAVGVRIDIVPDGRFAVIYAAGKQQGTASGLGGDIFKKESGGIKNEIAFDGGESRGEITDTQGGVVDMDAAGDSGAINGAFERRVNL